MFRWVGCSTLLAVSFSRNYVLCTTSAVHPLAVQQLLITTEAWRASQSLPRARIHSGATLDGQR